jgi:hypothetical protein
VAGVGPVGHFPGAAGADAQLATADEGTRSRVTGRERPHRAVGLRSPRSSGTAATRLSCTDRLPSRTDFPGRRLASGGEQDALAQQGLGIGLEQVAAGNIAKLADRAARGVISGEGDRR